MPDLSIDQALRLAHGHHQAGRPPQAEHLYRQILAYAPDHPDALLLLGILARQTNRPADAIPLLRRAADLVPDRVDAHYHLAAALHDRWDLPAAVDAYRRAADLRPDDPALHNDLGYALRDLGDLPASAAAFERAISLRPDFAEAHWNLSLTLLHAGDFARGWREFEWRLRIPRLALARDFPRPQWTGHEDLAGKTLLLYAEGGLGDTLQFARYIPLLASRVPGTTIHLECQPPLASLLAPIPGITSVIPRGQPLPPFDYHLPLPSLPLAFNTTPDTIPAAVPYFSAPADRLAAWRDRLAADSNLKVGLAWCGSDTAGDIRSRTLDTFAPLAACPNVTFYSLQHGPAAAQPVPPGLNLRAPLDPSPAADIADTASLIANLDLVITVDTSIVHLAGALARPVWTLIPARPDYRWSLTRPDSPWYPTMTLFRQTTPGQWSDVIDRLAASLRAHRP